MRVKRPVLADLALEAQLLAIGRQQEFDGRGVEAQAVVQRLHLMALVDTADGHHRHQHMHRFDQSRIAGEQRLDEERLVGNHNKVDPGAWDVDARQLGVVFHQLVDLGDDDPVTESRSLDQRRCVFGAWAGVEVAVTVSLVACDERNIRDEIHKQAGVELDVGVDGTDFQLTVFEQLRDAQTLRTGEGKIKLARDAALKQIQVFTAPDAGHDHV